MQFRELAFGKAFDWPSPRHGMIAGVEQQLDAAVRWQPRRRSVQDVRIFRLQRCECRMIGALEVQRGIDKSHRCQVELCAIRQGLDSGRKMNLRLYFSTFAYNESRRDIRASIVPWRFALGRPLPALSDTNTYAKPSPRRGFS